MKSRGVAYWSYGLGELILRSVSVSFTTHMYEGIWIPRETWSSVLPAVFIMFLEAYVPGGKYWIKKLVYLWVCLSSLPVEYVVVWIKMLEVFSTTEWFFFFFHLCVVLVYYLASAQSLLDNIVVLFLSVRSQKLLSWVNLCPANPFLKGIPWTHAVFLLVYWARACSQTLHANLYVTSETQTFSIPYL